MDVMVNGFNQFSRRSKPINITYFILEASKKGFLVSVLPGGRLYRWLKFEYLTLPKTPYTLLP
jgi:hypothetical protein